MDTSGRNNEPGTGRDGRNVVAAAFEALAATPRLSQTTLKVDLQNEVDYQQDIADPSQFATKPGITPSTPPRNFFVVTLIADIVAVNGQPAKGTYIGRTRVLSLSPNPTGLPNAEAIADVTRTALREHVFEILQPNGMAIGTIMSLGFSGGPPPPGVAATEHANWAIVGGTGAFLGARGTVGGTGGAGRGASMAEDPKNRRVNRGLTDSFLLHVIPMEAPRVVETADGPAIMHSSDSALVTPARPAAPGEVLYLFATGLGPAVPEVDLGLPFPPSPPSVVNSPVSVAVNGDAAEVLGATGFPGAVDGYQVNFQVPPNTAHGNATVQVMAAWIPSQPVNIPVH